MSLTGDGGPDDAALLFRVTRPFQAGLAQHVGLAVSGGSDSMAMLSMIAPWAKGLGLRVAVATVDHGLRSEARDEAAFVGRACAAIGVPHIVLNWRDRDGQGWDGRGNLQARAREARLALLAAWARESGIDTVALGHTMDDQAETVLLRLARGSGVDGLSGMAAERQADGLRWVRPLLQERREVLRDYLRRHGWAWVEDPSNADERFDRVRVRRALGLLGQVGIDVVGLDASAERMRLARDALELHARRAAREVARVEGGDVVFARAGFDLLPEETRLRLMADAIRWVSGTAYRPRLAALRRAMDEPGGLRRTLQGTVVTRGRGAWRVGRELAAVRQVRAPVGELWDGRWRVEGPPGEVRALGEAVAACPGWRATGLPRSTLMVSPAVWRDGAMVAAPVAGFGTGWTARIVAELWR